VQHIAQEKGGRCLSKEYITTITMMTWMCAKGHTWEATPMSVKGGSWCPECAKIESALKRKWMKYIKNV
jgi:hypothetical protein